MAEGKKSFILYADLIHTIEQMPADKAGELFLTILQYVNDQNPEPTDLLIKIAFEPIKRQMKRDLIKWGERADRSRENGKLGGRPKTQKNPDKPSGLINNPDEPGKPDTVNVTVNVNDTVNGTVTETVSVTENGINKREQTFSTEVRKFDYPVETLDAFIEYWTEPNKSKTKMRFEQERTWDTNRRLKRWAGNDFSKSSNKSKHPDKWDAKYEKTLDTDRLQDYWQHLKKLGYERKGSAGGTTWMKAV